MNGLEMAAITASVSFKVVMPPEILYEALVSGACPPTWSPHIGALIDEAPFEILVRAAGESSQRSGIAIEAIWEHIGRWAEAFKSKRPWPPFDDDAIVRMRKHDRRVYSTDQLPADLREAIAAAKPSPSARAFDAETVHSGYVDKTVKHGALVVADPAALLALGAAQALGALFALQLPVIIPDMVRVGVILDTSKPGAREAADWIRANEGERVRVASTEAFEEFQLLLAAAQGRSGRAAAYALDGAGDVVTRLLGDKIRGVIVLFGDGEVPKKANLLHRPPREVVMIATSELLSGLQGMNLLRDAMEIRRRVAAVTEEPSPVEIHRMSEDGTLEQWFRQMGIEAPPESVVPEVEEPGQREPADPAEIASRPNR